MNDLGKRVSAPETHGMVLRSEVSTMTSMEITELTGKQHKNVIRDIEAMVAALTESAVSISSWLCESSTYIDVQGKERKQYILDRNATLTLVSGYDIPLRMRIVQRWQELEGAEQERRSRMTRLEQVEELSRAYAELADSIRREELTRANNVLLARVRAEPGHAHLSVKDIKAQFAPYLSVSKLRLVLRYYGMGKTSFQFGSHENARLTVFRRDGLEEVFDRFRDDVVIEFSASGKSAIVHHDCFDDETARVPMDLAIEWLDCTEEDFAD